MLQLSKKGRTSCDMAKISFPRNRDDFVFTLTTGWTPLAHDRVVTSGHFFQFIAIGERVDVWTGISAQIVFTVIRTGSTWIAQRVRRDCSEIPCAVVMASVEVEASTLSHSTTDLI